VARINASDKFLKAYGALPDDHAVINLNLLQWRPLRDGAQYGAYGAVAGKGISAVGGAIVGAGLTLTDTDSIYDFDRMWDEIAFALYPRKRAYLQLQQDNDYQLAIPDRIGGTYRRMLHAISDEDPIFDARDTINGYHENKSILSAEGGSVIVAAFLRFKKDGGRAQYTTFAKNFQPILEAAGGYVALSSDAEYPIVSREYWDHFVTFVFPSREVMEAVLTSDEFLVANKDRVESLDASMDVAATMVDLSGE